MLSGLKGRLNTVARTQGAKPAAPASGDCLVLRADYPLDGAALEATEADMRLMCGEDGAGFDISRALFMDTETTGLAGGAGTLAFLTGLGWVEEGRFVVEQYFLRDYSEEVHMLARIARRMRGYTHLVTFNGKSFDCPLLESRFTLMRMRGDWPEFKQIDLLHPARRIWKLRLERCNLATLEERVLGVAREKDIPGAEVPERYFHYLKTHDFAEMTEVIEHNRQDIVTLMLLMGRMAGLMRAPLTAGHQEDIYSLGRALERGGCGERALGCFKATAHGLMAARANTSMSMMLKRQRALGEAMAVWLDMEERALGGVMPYIERSKVFEHRLRDWRRALDEVERAESYARALGDKQALDELSHRRERLTGKLKRQEENLYGSDGKSDGAQGVSKPRQGDKGE